METAMRRYVAYENGRVSIHAPQLCPDDAAEFAAATLRLFGPGRVEIEVEGRGRKGTKLAVERRYKWGRSRTKKVHAKLM